MRVYKAGNLVAEVPEKNNRKVQNGSAPYLYEFELKNLERNTNYIAKPTVKDGNNYYEADGFPFSDNDDDLTEDVHNIIPDDILEKFKELGITINGGNNPPNIEGTYFISPYILVKSNFADGFDPGYRFADMLMTFSKQDNAKLTVVCDYINGPGTGNGLGSFITGNGNKFSVYTEISGTLSGYTFKSVEIYSGEITPSGIKGFYDAFIVTKEAPSTIKRGQGRLIYDSDGFSERITQSNASILRNIFSSGVSVISASQSDN